MRVAIIDARDERLKELYDAVRQSIQDVKPVPVWSRHPERPPADLVLFHVGDTQTSSGEQIRAVLDYYSPTSWVLCYTGGLPEPEAEVYESATVALFRPIVGTNHPGEDIIRVVHKVLADLPRRDELPKLHFRHLVNGFDDELEAKLDVLCDILMGAEPREERLRVLRQCCPQTFEDAKLRFTAESVGDLRRLLFPE